MPRGILNVTDAKVTLSRMITKIKIEGGGATPVVIGRHGAAMAILISIEQFQEYRALAALAVRQQIPPPPNLVKGPGGGHRGGSPADGRSAVSGNDGVGGGSQARHES